MAPRYDGGKPDIEKPYSQPNDAILVLTSEIPIQHGSNRLRRCFAARVRE